MQREEQGTKEELLARLVDILEEVTRSGPSTIAQEWFTLDLTMPQVRVVFLLLQESPLRMSDLASSLGITFSRATGVVDRLVEQELVSRWTDPDDRRSVLCALTGQGEELGQRLLAARRARWEERLASLSRSELIKVRKAMELMRSAIHRAGPMEEPLDSASRQG